ncbi:MAG: hypothetical protein P1U70_24395 [Saprospiraceae bacterium]|jgi:hypothetical protein|nr:hypothetical protein [Saprospiraceae bacterium]
MKAQKPNLTFIWEDINIQVIYSPDYSKSFKQITGHRLAHLQIKADERLPMTETGYRSHFAVASEVEEYGSPINFVRAWLAEAEKKKGWQTYKREKQQAQQLSLF